MTKVGPVIVPADAVAPALETVLEAGEIVAWEGKSCGMGRRAMALTMGFLWLIMIPSAGILAHLVGRDPDAELAWWVKVVVVAVMALIPLLVPVLADIHQPPFSRFLITDRRVLALRSRYSGRDPEELTRISTRFADIHRVTCRRDADGGSIELGRRGSTRVADVATPWRLLMAKIRGVDDDANILEKFAPPAGGAWTTWPDEAVLWQGQPRRRWRLTFALILVAIIIALSWLYPPAAVSGLIERICYAIFL